jgi:putative SOS response-associated peptidase YedK
MCGRYNLTDSPQVQELLRLLGVELFPVRFSQDVAPGSIISIIHNPGDGRRISDALWWLMLDRKTLKADYRYASFNSRCDKLDTPRSLGYRPFRESRCIIPASAFIEGLGDKKTYHKIELEGCAIAFGGLCRHYLNTQTGESVFGASIITLPPMPAWEHIHPKSMPLMLPTDRPQVLDAWLNPQQTDTLSFAELLQPGLRRAQRVTRIGKPSQWNALGEPFVIEPSAIEQQD